ncbi:MAG: ACP S-malonyltransferase [Bacillota bacterium]|nr:ACP S-malonyltransferase [Bacillota bacterium]
MKTALCFAGQGAQYETMGRSLYYASTAAKKVLDAFESTCPGLLLVMFEGSKEELSRTENTQPCVFAHGAAAFAAAEEAGLSADMMAGFSLGEYTALACAGAFSPEEGLEIVIRRAAMMQAAIPAEGGAMAAILKLSDTQVIQLCEGIEGVWPVNFNCPQQVVVAGYKPAVEAAQKKAVEMGGRAIPLAVSGPFHTPLMEDAAKSLEKDFQRRTFNAPKIPVYANATAQPYGEDIKELLIRQVESPVLWEKTIRRMAEDGAELFIELGPGKVLTGFVRRILPEATIFNIDDEASLQNLCQALGLKAK